MSYYLQIYLHQMQGVVFAINSIFIQAIQLCLVIITLLLLGLVTTVKYLPDTWCCSYIQVI